MPLYYEGNEFCTYSLLGGIYVTLLYLYIHFYTLVETRVDTGCKQRRRTVGLVGSSGERSARNPKDHAVFIGGRGFVAIGINRKA